MLSTHWRRHYRPTDRELRFLDLLARQAADAIERMQAEEALREQMDDLSRFKTLVLGRESRMIDLKRRLTSSPSGWVNRGAIRWNLRTKNRLWNKV